MARREPKAALVIVTRGDGQVLAISRGDNLDDWGLPGGTADPEDQSLAHTAARELHEETGVVATELALVDGRVVGTHFVATFFAEEVEGWPDVLRSVPFEGYVNFVDPETLVAPTCRYREYAQTVLSKVGIL